MSNKQPNKIINILDYKKNKEEEKEKEARRKAWQHLLKEAEKLGW